MKSLFLNCAACNLIEMKPEHSFNHHIRYFMEVKEEKWVALQYLLRKTQLLQEEQNESGSFKARR
jgi:hypothetical protein